MFVSRRGKIATHFLPCFPPSWVLCLRTLFQSVCPALTGLKSLAHLDWAQDHDKGNASLLICREKPSFMEDQEFSTFSCRKTHPVEKNRQSGPRWSENSHFNLLLSNYMIMILSALLSYSDRCGWCSNRGFFTTLLLKLSEKIHAKCSLQW